MRKTRPHNVSPDFVSREKESLRRRNKVVMLLNDKEMDALNRYRKTLKGKSMASICREAVMEKVISGLEENQPTLF